MALRFNHPTAEVFVPDQAPVDRALARTTHMGIGAHQDDLEFMALDGILKCYQDPDQWFLGVTVTDGSGSSRSGDYAPYTDVAMRDVRRSEQRKAAFVGEYGAVAQLDFTSADVKNPSDRALVDDLKQLIVAATPRVLYTHNLADKHDTHIGVALAVLRALRELPADQRPSAVYGCEVWRNLDWMLDEEKVMFDVSGRENISAALMGIFDSQISGGKRYDLATIGRKRSNATYLASHASDKAKLMEYAMDLTPLVQDPQLDITAFTCAHIDRFRQDVAARLAKRLGC